MIEFKDITKTYQGNAEVLKGVSFTIESGKLVSVIGRSGCGKTTLLRMVNRLVKPSQGHIFVDGNDIDGLDPIRLRRNIGYVIQQVGLFPHMTVAKNIMIIPKAEHFAKDKMDERCRQLLTMVGLDPDKYMNRYPSELSGGQQQRVGIARALAMDPKIILMDEPFSALDPLTRSSLQDQLLDLQTKMHKTILFVTHDMDEAIKLSDKICVMRKGKVLQYDTPENILKNPANQYVSEFVGPNRIWSSPEFIKVRDIMIKDPRVTKIGQDTRRALEKMREGRVDTLLVVDGEDNRYLGIISANRLRQQPDLSVPIDRFIDSSGKVLRPGENIVDALKIMNEHGQHLIPVVTKAGSLAGLVTRSSLLTVLSQQYFSVEEDGGHESKEVTK